MANRRPRPGARGAARRTAKSDATEGGRPARPAGRAGRRRAPAPSGGRNPVPLILGGLGVVVVIIVAIFAFGGGDDRGDRADRRETASTNGDAAPNPKPAPDPKPDPAPDPKPKPAPKPAEPRYKSVGKYKKLLAAVEEKPESVEDLYELAYYLDERRSEDAKAEAKKWAKEIVKRNPLHGGAHEILGRVEFLGDYIPEAERDKRLEEPWYKVALETRERKFLQDQQLRDLGLVYHASMPWVIAKERNDRLPRQDHEELAEIGAILTATYHRFQELFGKRFDLPSFEGAGGNALAIGVFWFDSERSFRRAFRRVRGLKRDVESAAAFYTHGDPKELRERMIFGYTNRRARNRTFDNNKLAHEASHALEDHYRKELGKHEDPAASGTWWFSEGLAEFIGTLESKETIDEDGNRTFKVTFLERNEERFDSARMSRRVGWSIYTEIDDANVGMRDFVKLKKGDEKPFPFSLRELIDLRHGGDLDARGGAIGKEMGNAMVGRMIGSIAYFQAWALVCFMWESGGEYREALMRCFDARRNNKDHADVTAVTFKGVDLDELESKWLEWIAKTVK